MDSNYKTHVLWKHTKYRELYLNLIFKMGFKHMFDSLTTLEEYINKIFQKNKNITDIELHKKLRRLYRKFKLPKFTIHDYTRIRVSRSNLRWREILQLNKYIMDLDLKEYLDFGAGDCSMSVLLGQHMKLKKKNIHAVDIENWEGVIDDYGIYRKDCQFVTYDGKKLPYVASQFDIITCFQVLHHIDNINDTLSEMNRVMKIGGILIIREHHCHNNKMQKLIGLEHELHEQVITKNVTYNDTYSKYRKRKDLKKKIKDAGFLWQAKYKEPDSFWNPTNYYYELYVKT